MQAGPGRSLPSSLIFIFFAILEYKSDFSILIDKKKIGQTGFTEKGKNKSVPKRLSVLPLANAENDDSYKMSSHGPITRYNYFHLLQSS